MQLRIRQDQRGISNVIVVMLSLVILVIISANVILWSYQMNQFDWERMQEDVSIVDVRDTWSYNPSGYGLGGPTSLVSGSVSNLKSDDGVYMTFRSYYSGTDTSDFVDNDTSDVDSSPNKGTHSNFTAQQYGPDSIYDTLTEENTAGGNGTFGKTDIGNSTMEENENRIWACKFYLSQGGQVTKLTAYLQGTDPNAKAKAAIYDHDDAHNKPNNRVGICSTEVVLGNTLQWHDFVLDSPVTLNAGYYWLAIHYGVKHTILYYDSGTAGQWQRRDADYRKGPPDHWGQTKVKNDWEASIYASYTPTNYELDLEVQWISVDFDETNEELCIYGGTMGSENITVDVWNSTAWKNLFTDLSSGWNNVSVSSYLKSSTFTIRFKGGTETGDTNQNSWNIDVTLLHVWSDEYTLEVEFTGSSNMEDWSRLTWTVDSAWTAGSVNVTLQLYNYTLNGYPTSGNGYIVYTSDDTPNTDETKNQTITVNPTHFRNATGYWRMKVKGVKATDEQFDLKVDWVEFKAVIASGTLFTFENGSSLTSHLVSLWIINSTVHQRYDISVFVNSGETLPYLRVDICLPSGEYVVKVVTERGNTAVYSGS